VRELGRLSQYEWADDEFRHRWLFSNREAKCTALFCGQPFCVRLRTPAHDCRVVIARNCDRPLAKCQRFSLGSEGCLSGEFLVFFSEPLRQGTEGLAAMRNGKFVVFIDVGERRAVRWVIEDGIVTEPAAAGRRRGD